MLSHFPEEIIVKILRNLPVKCLVRCTSVCKSWYSLIKNPAFISTHLSRVIASPPTDTDGSRFLLHLVADEKQLFSLHYNDEDFTQHERIQFPPFESLSPSSLLRVVGCIHGLVCIADDDGDHSNFILWNPSIKKFITLPEPNVPYTRRAYDPRYSRTIVYPRCSFLTFGYDSRSDDFKLLRVLASGLKPYEVEVFSLNASSWKKLAIPASECYIVDKYPLAFVNGHCHWITTSNYQRDDIGILAFDVGVENFHEIILPMRYSRWSAFLVTYAESSISLVVGVDINYLHNQAACDIWVMREYGDDSSWSRLFTVAYLGFPLSVMGFKNDQEMLSIIDGEVVTVDLENKRMKHLGIQAKTGGDAPFIKKYVGSLVLLDKGIDIPHMVEDQAGNEGGQL